MITEFLSTTPIFIVNDPEKARDFYVEKLGFEVSFEWGVPITYLGIKRNDVEIHLNSSSNSTQQPGNGTISIFTDEVDNLYENYRSKGVETTIEPADRDYGLRDFGVTDLDGNIINFGCNVRA